jgi:heme A synthase
MMFRGFALAAALGALLLAVRGSWVRINGAGMSCPDWPLCHGALIPSMADGVIFEWSHRLVAAIEAIVVVAALATGWQARKRIAGVTPVLAFIGVVFVLQVGLGGLTVALANSPWSVVVHWATAMLLLGGLTALAVLAVAAPRQIALPRTSLGAAIVAALVCAFGVMCAGAYVSSSGAGLACTTLPACDGGSLVGTSAAQTTQMVHRLLAGTLFVVLAFACILASANGPSRVRTVTFVAAALLVMQIALGFANVAWLLPTALREAHAANACVLYLSLLAAATFAAIDGTAPAAVRVAASRTASGAEIAR